MKQPEIVVGEVKIGELRKRLRQLLELKVPRIVQRNSRPVAILLSVETLYYRQLKNPTSQKRRLRAELEAVLAKLES